MKKNTKKTTTPAPVAAKAPAATKPAAVSAAPVAPIKAASNSAKTKAITAAAPTTIEAKIDIGFGNQLFVRGQGAGLSWEQGTPLECVDSKTWRLTVPAKDKLQFKLLLNDAIWAKGEDVVAAPGRRVELVPAF